jgi:hypothetical protein
MIVMSQGWIPAHIEFEASRLINAFESVRRAKLGPDRLASRTELLLPIDPLAVAREVLHARTLEPPSIPTTPQEDLEGITIVGMVDRQLPEPTIVVASNAPSRQRVFTAGHEVGHFVLHREMEWTREGLTDAGKSECACDRPVEEIQADRFASALLMPADLMLSIFREYFGTDISIAMPTDHLLNWVAMKTREPASVRRLRQRGVDGLCMLFATAPLGPYETGRCLSDIFGVSPLAMAIRLKQLDRVHH